MASNGRYSIITIRIGTRDICSRRNFYQRLNTQNNDKYITSNEIEMNLFSEDPRYVLHKSSLDKRRKCACFSISDNLDADMMKC